MATTALGMASEENSLVERIAAGDPNAIGRVYDQHHSLIRRFAQRLVGTDAIAEDLVQEVFLALPSAIRGFKRACTLRTFLISIAVNHARHHVRAATRRRKATARLGLEIALPGPSTPEDDATRRRLATALSRALDQLPVKKRVAFVLCVVEERSSTEVAEILGVPEATVRTRVFSARKKLREILTADASPRATAKARNAARSPGCNISRPSFVL